MGKIVPKFHSERQRGVAIPYFGTKICNQKLWTTFFIAERRMPYPSRRAHSITTMVQTMEQLDKMKDTINYFSSFPPPVTLQLCPYLHDRVKRFFAGQIQYYLSQWQHTTSEQYIQMVLGDTIVFNDSSPGNNICPNNHIANDSIANVKAEIDSLLAKRVIVSYDHAANEFISPIFSVPKPDNQVRLILNLKSLNSHVVYHHFKMDSIHTVTCTVEVVQYSGGLTSVQ